MPSSRLDIVNQALLLLADVKVDDINQEHPGAGLEVANQVWDQTRDTALMRTPWRFATREELLTKAADEDGPPEAGWRQKYRLPAQCLSVHGMRFADGTPSEAFERNIVTGQAYELYGPFLVCNHENVVVNYTRRVEEAEWPATFVRAVAMDLAAQMAPAVTGNERVSRGWAERAAMAYQQAATIDAQMRPEVRRPWSRLHIARHGG